MKTIQIIFALFVFTLSIVACSNKGDQENVNILPEESIDLNDFYDFYQRFHNDSLFQMTHIIFPLKGLPREVDSTTYVKDDFVWTEEDWILHKSFDFEVSGFEREIKPFGPNMIQEKITHKKTGSGMTRRFAKLGDKDWNLIYYADFNFYTRD